MQYVGLTWSTSVEFDASWDRGQPFTFKLGKGKVIKGWDEGIPGMRKGGRRELTIPADLAYGAQGSPPTIGPNECLRFIVDLVKLKKRPRAARRARPRARAAAARGAAARSRSRCSSQSRIAPSMNHSHARTAARRSGVVAPGRPARIRSAVAARTRLDQLAHLGHGAGAADELRVGVAVLLDPAEEGVELLAPAARSASTTRPRARRRPAASVAPK